LKYEIFKNPQNITLEQMEKLNLSCFPDEPYDETFFKDMLKLHYWVVSVEHELVGFSYVKILEGDVHISRIAILKEYRRNRLGQKLVEEMEMFSSNMDSSKITLSVIKNNIPAITLYKKHQFVETGEKHQFSIDINEIIKNNENTSVEAINLSSPLETNGHRFDIHFVLTSGEIIGECKLDTNFPGCSHYYLINPESDLEASLASLGKYLNPEKNDLKIIFSDHKLMTTCMDNGYRLNSSLMKMEKTLI